MAKSNKEAMLANLMPKTKKAIPQPITTSSTQVAEPIAAKTESATEKVEVATKTTKKVAAKNAKPAPVAEKARFNLVMDKGIYIKFKQHLVTLPMNGSEYMEHLIMKDLGLIKE